MKLSSVINMLNYISGSSSNEKSDDTINMLEKVKDDFTQMKDEYYYKSAEFYEYLIQILHQLNLSLDLENIRDNISEFNKFINKDKKGAFGKYLKNVNETIKLRTNKISGFIANKKAHLKMLEYYSENEKYLPEHIRLKTKISKFKPDNVVLKNLPFYYLQLFKGNRFSLPGKNEIRESELNEAVKSIENNSEGGAAFLVTGASGIGKSWFLENLAGELSVSQPVYLNILEYIERSKFPLKQLISDISGMNGNLTTIINKYPVGTVFVIEDIENYISGKEGERFMLDVLSELIDRFGNKFYFLFSANINSLKIIEESIKLINSI
ncbi:MAG TPA: ATP-binding protein [Saprospiraceae bacterium]|nr:ATP-binding protein [Saprospiraceae bacterium]